MAAEDIVVDEKALQEETGVQDAPINPRTMSYEDLQKELYGKQPEGADTTVTEPEKKADETKAEETKTEDKAAAGEKPDEKAETETKVEPDEKETLKNELADLKKRVEAQDKFLAKRSTELGLLKKTTPMEELVEQKRISEEYNRIHLEEGPFQADQYYKAEKQKIEAAKAMAEHQEYEQKIADTRQVITQYVPDFDSKIEPIVKIMEEDKANPENIAVFRANPYIVDPVTLYNMVKRADLTSRVNTLTQENESLKSQIAELKKQPGELIQKIKDATHSVTGKSTGTATPPAQPDLSGVNVRRLPLDRLKEIEKQYSTAT